MVGRGTLTGKILYELTFPRKMLFNVILFYALGAVNSGLVVLIGLLFV